MKLIKSNKYIVIAAMILMFFADIQVVFADESGASFNEELLVSETELSSQRGQGGGIVTSAQVQGNVTYIGAGGSQVNGDNIISDQSMNNVNGIATVIQNSGNNVAIQNNTVVNVSFQ
ncbi:MAG: hypothetical protein ABL933_05195 [Methyloglobulus sp.]|nr:hypothetical protein [Methyloglobulus sp.]